MEKEVPDSMKLLVLQAKAKKWTSSSQKEKQPWSVDIWTTLKARV